MLGHLNILQHCYERNFSHANENTWKMKKYCFYKPFNCLCSFLPYIEGTCVKTCVNVFIRWNSATYKKGKPAQCWNLAKQTASGSLCFQLLHLLAAGLERLCSIWERIGPAFLLIPFASSFYASYPIHNEKSKMLYSEH